MAAANLPALPQISATLAGPPAKPQGRTDAAGGEQGFARALDRHLQPKEAAKPEHEIQKTPESAPSPGPDAKAASARDRSLPGKPADETRARPLTEPLPEPLADPLGDPLGGPLSGPLSDALANALAGRAAPDETAAGTTDPAATEDEDALQASLAGLPAALAALLAGGAAAPATAPSAPAEGGATAVAAPRGDGALATLARLLAESAGRPAEATAQVADSEPAAGASGPDDLAGTFAAALESADARDSVGGRGEEPAVLSAVETESGPASRAADAAQLAANPAAGDAAASRPEPNPAAAQAWAAAPGRPGHEDAGPRLTVTQPPGHPAWADAVGSKVSWLVGQHESKAELVLTPPQLGRVEVTLSVSGDQTTAQFVAATPAAREALEQALPRLREVLAEAGIQLAQSGVSTSDQRGAGGETPRQGGRRHEGGGVPGGEINTAGQPWLRRGQGLVDTFA